MATVGDLDNVYPVGTNLGSWPDGGSAASTTSIPSSQSGTDPNYWLPIWSGEVLNAYSEYNMFENLVQSDTITSGTTKRFPITGTVGIKPIWNAGEELVMDSGTTNSPGWFDISLDQRPMASHFELDDIHLMLTQWDYRSEIARQAGLQLANARDKQIACMIGQAAFTENRSPYGTGLAGCSFGGGAAILPPDSAFNDLGFGTETLQATAALKLLSYIEEYMVHLQEVNVDTRDVYVAVNPRTFHSIRTLGIARARTDMYAGGNTPMFVGNASVGGLGTGLANGMTDIQDTLEYFGAKIIKTNHLQLKNVVAGTVLSGSATVESQIGDAKYDFNWYDNDVKALIWQRQAVCSLRLQGMKVESIKDVRRGTNFTVASIMGGAGILRPELCSALCGVAKQGTQTGVSVNTSVAAGGGTHTLTGTQFYRVAGVTVGGTAATNVKMVNDVTLTFKAPAKAAGDHAVVATTAFGACTGTVEITYS